MPSPEFTQRPGSIWEVFPFAGKSMPQTRAEMEDIAVHTCRPPMGIRWEPGELGGVQGKWVFPREDRGNVMLYFHGGGFTLGSSGISLPFLVELADTLDLAAFSADYALAPEKPFPAPQQDALAAYEGLLAKGYRGENIILAGDSAGATLALVLVLQLREKRLPPPRAVVAMSPAVNCTRKSEAKVLDTLPGMEELLKVYAPGADPAHPWLSPVLADLKDFVPTLLIAGGAEALLEDSLEMANALIRAGNDVELIVGREMIHTYPLDFADYPEAAEAFSEIVSFIRIKLGLED